MSLIELVHIIPPPVTPVGVTDSVKWPDIEHRLGVQLPDDYKELMLTYGMGYFPGDLVVYHPFDHHERNSLLVTGLHETASCERLTNDFDFPYSFYPNRPGLLACGHVYQSAGIIFWLTESSHTNWPIIASGRDIGEDGKYHRFDCSITTFLAHLYQRKLAVPFWDFTLESYAPEFVPF